MYNLGVKNLHFEIVLVGVKHNVVKLQVNEKDLQFEEGGGGYILSRIFKVLYFFSMTILSVSEFRKAEDA